MLSNTQRNEYGQTLGREGERERNLTERGTGGQRKREK